MTTIIELQPNRNLLNSNFEKYQFSADILPIKVQLPLNSDVLRIEPGNNQDSWLEARLFAFHNHLFANPYDSSSWFIDKNMAIWRIDRERNLVCIHTMDNSSIKETDLIYNPSIGFATRGIVVISNGKDSLELLLCNGSKRLKNFTLENHNPGVVMNVQYVSKTSTVIVVVCSINENNGKKCTKLSLLSYLWTNENSDDENFKLSRTQVLEVKGTVEYVYVEDNGENFHTLCQDCIIFEDKIQSKEETEIKIPKYCWSQDKNSITVWLKLSENYNKQTAKINVTATSISITINDKTLMEGDCQHRLEEGLTTWKQEGDTLQIDLMKHESGLMWNELIKGDTGGECLPNQELAAEIHSKLAHLCTDQSNENIRGDQPVLGFNAEQLEECDIQGGVNLFQRVNLKTQETTHLATLGTNNCVLFSYMEKNGQVICLRHDHDGCVWVTDQTNRDQWNVQHVSTFPGFGYVEASKSNKKFCISPPDRSYVAIIEHIRNIFIYEKPTRGSNIGKQKIIDLGSESAAIMGAVSTNNYLIILTRNKLYEIQVRV